MPSEYECEQCHLNFTVGWYHYHVRDTGYGGRTLLVCKDCGTIHSIEHPVRGAVVPEHLQWQDQPLFKLEKIAARRPTHHTGWQGSESMEGRKIKHLICHHCHAKGTLLNDWPFFGAPCPKCGHKIKKAIAAWRT